LSQRGGDKSFYPVEVAPLRTMEGLNDVSNKVAYAYARYQASWVIAATVLLGGLLATIDELDVPLSTVDDLFLVLVGVGIAVLALRNRDLKRINRGTLILLGAAFLVKVVFALLESPEDRLDESVWLVALGLLLVAYFLPRRLGRTVLYPPRELRALSNGRTFAIAFLLALVFSGLGEVVLGVPARSPLGIFDLVVAVPALVGLLVYLVHPCGARLTAYLTGFCVVSSVGALLAAGSTWMLGDRLDEQLVALAALLSALVIVWGLSHRINQGKTIIAHRA
jgi:hypothetical protein